MIGRAELRVHGDARYATLGRLAAVLGPFGADWFEWRDGGPGPLARIGAEVEEHRAEIMRGKLSRCIGVEQVELTWSAAATEAPARLHPRVC